MTLIRTPSNGRKKKNKTHRVPLPGGLPPEGHPDGAPRFSEEQFRGAFESAAIGMAIVSIDGRWIQVNAALCNLLGFAESELIGMTYAEVTHPDDLEADLGLVRRLLAGEIPSFQMDKRYIHKLGQIVWAHLQVSLVRDGAGIPQHFVSQIEDVTAQRRAELALAESEERLRMALEAANMGCWTWDVCSGELSNYGNISQLFGLDAGTALGSISDYYENLIHPDDRERVKQNDALINASGSAFEIEYRVVHASGDIRWLREVGKVTRDAEAKPLIQYGVTMDVTERKQLEERLVYQAFHDSLTGLPNRALFTNLLSDAMNRCAENGQNVALLFLDLDGFKTVNDSLGHDFGDELLVAVARRLEAALEQNMCLARLGGDEFTVLIEGLVTEQDARVIAENLVLSLRPPFKLADQHIFMTSSVGIAVSGPEDRAADLLRRSDVAMYEAKSGGRARFAMFDAQMDEAVMQRVRLESELRTAIDQGQLRLHFQPLVDLTSGVIGQVEALVRWEHPERGMIAPDQFIPLAEQTGLIVQLGRWVLFEACRQLQEWDAVGVGDRDLVMSVNLSPRQLRDPRLVTDIAQVLLATGVEPRRIQLEVTETMAVDNDDLTMSTLRTLRSMGLRLAIDDFGAGYSAFSYLRRCEVDSLKIDRSYVSSLVAEDSDDRMVKAVIAFTQALGIETVGEGIETSEQAVRLREMGCDVGQGYLFSRPLPADQLTAILNARAESRTSPGAPSRSAISAA